MHAQPRYNSQGISIYLLSQSSQHLQDMLLIAHLTDETTESQEAQSPAPVPELESRDSRLKSGLRPSPTSPPHSHPIPCPTPEPPAKQVDCQVEQLFPKQTLHKLSCPGLFLTFNAWLLLPDSFACSQPRRSPCQILLFHFSGAVWGFQTRRG